MKPTPAQRIMAVPDQVAGLITQHIVIVEYLGLEDQEMHLGWFYDPDSRVWQRIGLLESVLASEKAHSI